MDINPVAMSESSDQLRQGQGVKVTPNDLCYSRGAVLFKRDGFREIGMNGWASREMGDTQTDRWCDVHTNDGQTGDNEKGHDL